MHFRWALSCCILSAIGRKVPLPSAFGERVRDDSVDNVSHPMTRSLDNPIVFCGTPQFAVPTLQKLVETFNIRLVVTQPDRPKGRGLELVASPVKQSALELSLPIYQPEKIKTNEELKAKLAEINPDAIIVVGYGRIIPAWMLQL